jgi:hypothetical protein
MRRIVMVMCAVVAVLGLSPVSAGAAPDSTAIFHFKGRAGSVVLTDCPVSGPAGTHCRAVNVFAFEQRVNDDGDKSPSGPGFDAELYDVTLLDAAPFFEAVLIGQGHSDTPTVKINGNLSSGVASVRDVPLCDAFACAPGDPTSISITVQWSGFGPTDAFREHDRNNDPICFFNERTTGTVRSANAVGTVDGVTWVVPSLPGFQPTLQSDGFGSISRCPL